MDGRERAARIFAVGLLQHSWVREQRDVRHRSYVALGVSYPALSGPATRPETLNSMNTPRPMLLAALLIYASALQAQSDSTDWKFFSTSAQHADSLPELLSFYLGNGIKSLSSGHIEVWTKGLSAKEVTTAYNKIGKNDDLTGQVARKVIGGYKPPYARIHELTPDEVINIAAWEGFANEANISPQLQRRNARNLSAAARGIRAMDQATKVRSSGN
jgi:hypothetical protein